jgi:hypothetical protein
MKTDDLIAAMAADTLPRPSLVRQSFVALLAALVVSALAFALLWGPRVDIWAALSSWAVLKTLMPLVFVGLSLGLVLVMAHPGRAQGRLAYALAAALGLAALALLVTVAQGQIAGLVAALSTPSLFVCLTSIPVLALPFGAALFWGLSAGAVLQPRRAGAVAGLAAGAAAAALYSLYCDKDMVLFVLPAYGTAISFVALIGALLGPRFLKW